MQASVTFSCWVTLLLQFSSTVRTQQTPEASCIMPTSGCSEWRLVYPHPGIWNQPGHSNGHIRSKSERYRETKGNTVLSRQVHYTSWLLSHTPLPIFVRFIILFLFGGLRHPLSIQINSYKYIGARFRNLSQIKCRSICTTWDAALRAGR